MSNREAKAVGVFLLLWLPIASSSLAEAQVNGQPVVYSAASSSNIAYSPAYIDASVFYYANNESYDICKTINKILTGASGIGYPSAGVVIDTRGILEGQNAGLCTINPFDSVATSFQTTILLPATTIATECPWVLPSYTRIVGAGRGATTLAISSIRFDPDSTNSMIEMGSAGGGNPGPDHCSATTTTGYYACPSAGCTGTSIEHLAISPFDTGQRNQPYTAIYNNYAGDQSYVDDVVLRQVGQNSTSTSMVTGLFIGPGATYSGPYTNIDFVGSQGCGSGSTLYTCQYTACVQIQAQTRGLHGITCTAKTQTATSSTGLPFAAIYLDSYGNTVSDVHVEGFYDGVVVGDYQQIPTSAVAVAGNTISNVTVGDGGTSSGPTYEAVHICNPGATTQGLNTACTTNSSGSVSDVTVAGVLSNGAGLVSAYPLVDDLSTTQITASTQRAFLGTYVLGEKLLGFGNSNVVYSRSTTGQSGSGNIPSWGVGSTSAVGLTCTTPGALYSNTTGTGTASTLFLCSGGTWHPIG